MTVPDGTRIVVDDSHDFKSYARGIKSFSFHIETYYPEISPELPASSHNAGLAFIPGRESGTIPGTIWGRHYP